ncbi:hypothetical protein H6F95_13870 [Cyanobacteria bacterium FACHB-471]|nr:hypothetical protein [Cyanobacteria bacterium FACHB-471]
MRSAPPNLRDTFKPHLKFGAVGKNDVLSQILVNEHQRGTVSLAIARAWATSSNQFLSV